MGVSGDASFSVSLQLEARPVCTLICGKSASGKSTFALRHLVNLPRGVIRFVFDPRGEYQRRLNLAAAETEEELNFALADGWVIYEPGAMFPGNSGQAFEWFAGWVFAQASRLPGRKVFFVDEVWKFCSRMAIPQPLAVCVQEGRKAGLEMSFATQRPELISGAIVNERTEVVCFRLQEQISLDKAAAWGFEPAEVLALPAGAFIARNCESDAVLRGRVF